MTHDNSGANSDVNTPDFATLVDDLGIDIREMLSTDNIGDELFDTGSCTVEIDGKPYLLELKLSPLFSEQ